MHKELAVPWAPAIGESIQPNTSHPRPVSAAATSSQHASMTAGSRITPLPRSTSALPASNCGLTNSTRSPRGGTRR